MTKAKCSRFLAVLGSTVLWAAPNSVWSQPNPVTNAVRPTVTVEMGELGGKFFGSSPDPAKTRHYYIAAEPERWDYAPEGRDVICGKPLPPPVIANRRGSKLRYVQYTDATFAARVIQNPSLGILGPALRGVVGEYIAITFLNRTPSPVSMHPHGLRYDRDSEGTYHDLKPGLGGAVGPGAKCTYVWQLDASSGPMPGEPSSRSRIITGSYRARLAPPLRRVSTRCSPTSRAWLRKSSNGLSGLLLPPATRS